MQRTAVLDVVGLSTGLLARMPRLAAWAGRQGVAHVEPMLPAVTCPVQSTYLTGALPRDHGIVGNGWFFRDEGEIRFWRQSNRLVQRPKIWEIARSLDPDFTCANLFWWYNMCTTVDVAVTPRPMYPADGRKLPDIYTRPAQLRPRLQRELGQFPLFDFWGPRASIRSSEWIAAAAQRVEDEFRPTLSLVYLPHLDYPLQRQGPDGAIGQDLEAIDRVAGELIAYYEARGVKVVVLSEYAISGVDQAVALNRSLREHGCIEVREELGLELLDAGASRAFAVADHQVAHVYVQDASAVRAVRRVLEAVPGVGQVYERCELPALDHPRAGELVAVAAPGAWFSYYYWLDDRKAPDFARTVDIHRKPGYDPAELFIDPRIALPSLKIAWRLLQKRLGLRALLDVIPLEGALVRGSHGRPDPAQAPVLIGERVDGARRYAPEEVMAVILAHLADRDEVHDMGCAVRAPPPHPARLVARRGS